MSAYGGAAALVVNKQETDRERRIRLRKQEFAAKNYSEKSLIPAEQPGTGSGSQLPALSHGSRRVPSAGSESSRTRDEVYEQKRKRFLELQAKLRPEEAQRDRNPFACSTDLVVAHHQVTGSTPEVESEQEVQAQREWQKDPSRKDEDDTYKHGGYDDHTDLVRRQRDERNVEMRREREEEVRREREDERRREREDERRREREDERRREREDERRREREDERRREREEEVRREREEEMRREREDEETRLKREEETRWKREEMKIRREMEEEKMRREREEEDKVSSVSEKMELARKKKLYAQELQQQMQEKKLVVDSLGRDKREEARAERTSRWNDEGEDDRTWSSGVLESSRSQRGESDKKKEYAEFLRSQMKEQEINRKKRLSEGPDMRSDELSMLDQLYAKSHHLPPSQASSRSAQLFSQQTRDLLTTIPASAHPPPPPSAHTLAAPVTSAAAAAAAAAADPPPLSAMSSTARFSTSAPSNLSMTALSPTSSPGGLPEEIAKHREQKRLEYAEELRKQVELARRRKEREKEEELERERREEERLQRDIEMEKLRAQVPRDQFGNPLKASHVVANAAPAAPVASNRRESRLTEDPMASGAEREGRGGSQARAVDQEQYKAELELQIEERRRRKQAEQEREAEEERKDAERLERQLAELAAKAEMEDTRSQRAASKSEAEEAERSMGGRRPPALDVSSPAPHWSQPDVDERRKRAEEQQGKYTSENLGRRLRMGRQDDGDEGRQGGKGGGRGRETPSEDEETLPDMRSLLDFAREGSVEETLAALRRDLLREHSRLQAELGLPVKGFPSSSSSSSSLPLKKFAPVPKDSLRDFLRRERERPLLRARGGGEEERRQTPAASRGEELPQLEPSSGLSDDLPHTRFPGITRDDLKYFDPPHHKPRPPPLPPSLPPSFLGPSAPSPLPPASLAPSAASLLLPEDLKYLRGSRDREWLADERRLKVAGGRPTEPKGDGEQPWSSQPRLSADDSREHVQMFRGVDDSLQSGILASDAVGEEEEEQDSFLAGTLPIASSLDISDAQLDLLRRPRSVQEVNRSLAGASVFVQSAADVSLSSQSAGGRSDQEVSSLRDLRGPSNKDLRGADDEQVDSLLRSFVEAGGR